MLALPFRVTDLVTSEKQALAAVAGASKLKSRTGCTTCRQRRKKCDEKRPACSACVRLGVKCRWPDTRLDPEREQLSAERRYHAARIQWTIRSDSNEIPDNMALHAFSDDIFISFTLHTLFKGANTPFQRKGFESSLTVQSELQFAQASSSMSRKCLLATSMLHYGLHSRRKDIAGKAVALHGQNLRSIATAISEPRAGRLGDMTASIVFTGLFSMSSPHHRGDWYKHVAGLGRLFETFGPESFRDPQLRRLFENNRMNIVMSASVLRQPTFLETKRWRSIPWDGLTKDSFQTLVDVYALLPRMHWQSDQSTPSQSDEEDSARSTLRELAIQALDELDAWRSTFNIDLGPKLYAMANQADMAGLNMSKKAIGCDKTETAFSLALFNTVLIAVCQYWYLVSRSSETHSVPIYSSSAEPPSLSESNGDCSSALTDASVWPIVNIQERTSIACDEIIRLIPWTLQDHISGAGSLYMAAPIIQCIRVIDEDATAKREYLGQAFVKVRDHWGSIATF